MALNWKTYVSIPRLYTYADALAHYNDTKPIRGDAYETRPCGRRDQKWFSIWQDKDRAIHAGYGYGKPEERRSLVSWHPNGTIRYHKRTMWSSASSNERRQRLLGVECCTHMYDTWVRCAWYDGGERRKGWLPLRATMNRNYHGGEDVLSVFARDGDGTLVYLNYVYPVTHKPNKARLKDALAPFQPFLKFVEGMAKLQGGSISTHPETQAEYFGWGEPAAWDRLGEPRPIAPPSIQWGHPEPLAEARRQFFAWAASEDLGDRMRALITLGNHTNPRGARLTFTDLLLKLHHASLLDIEVHTDGKRVTDRYKRYLRG